MGFGQLRCIGTQMHLKNKFGDGFKLTLNCSRDGQDVSALLDELCPGARLVHSCVSLCLCVSALSFCLSVCLSLFSCVHPCPAPTIVQWLPQPLWLLYRQTVNPTASST
eukprot:COSAG03_NODE_7217_length_947_cov_2.892689_2_plen_109_part_00